MDQVVQHGERRSIAGEGVAGQRVDDHDPGGGAERHEGRAPTPSPGRRPEQGDQRGEQAQSVEAPGPGVGDRLGHQPERPRQRATGGRGHLGHQADRRAGDEAAGRHQRIAVGPGADQPAGWADQEPQDGQAGQGGGAGQDQPPGGPGHHVQSPSAATVVEGRRARLDLHMEDEGPRQHVGVLRDHLPGHRVGPRGVGVDVGHHPAVAVLEADDAAVDPVPVGPDDPHAPPELGADRLVEGQLDLVGAGGDDQVGDRVRRLQGGMGAGRSGSHQADDDEHQAGDQPVPATPRRPGRGSNAGSSLEAGPAGGPPVPAPLVPAMPRFYLPVPASRARPVRRLRCRPR